MSYTHCKLHSARARLCLQANADACSGTRAVDALLRWPGGAAALEVDGPTHLLNNTATGDRVLLSGGTVLRNSALRRAGLQVICVPVTDRSVPELHSKPFKRELAQLLRAAGVPLAWDTAEAQQAAADSLHPEEPTARQEVLPTLRLKWRCKVFAAQHIQHARG